LWISSNVTGDIKSAPYFSKASRLKFQSVILFAINIASPKEKNR